MKFGMSSCTVYRCLQVAFILTSASSQDISMSPPDTEGWLSPDPDFFPPGQAPQSDILGVNKLDVECQENLKVCATRYADCEKSLQNTILDKNKLTDVPLNEVSTSSTVAPKVDGAKVYLQRFIRKLLEISDLNTGDVEVQNTAEIKIYISDEQLMIFRQFAKEGKIPLRKLDAIFDAVFVKPYFNLPKVEKLYEKLPSIQVGSFFLSILLPAVWFMSVLLATRNIRKSFTWFLPITFVTSFITTANRMFEEGQLKQYEQMKKFADIPSDCRENGRSLLSYFFSSGKTNCAKYLVAHNIDPNLHITPVKVITKIFGETLSDTMENIGAGSIGFFQQFSEMGLLTQALVLPLGCTLLFSIGLLIFLVITGGSIRLPYFLGSVNFNSTTNPPSSHDGGPDTTRPFKRLETTPSTSNITFNFNSQIPPNVHEILLQSLPQGAHHLESLPRAIRAGELPSPSNSMLQLGAGDGPTVALVDNSSNASDILHKVQMPNRPAFCSGNKKSLRQFSQLEAKYKAGGKLASKFKVRKMSL